MLTYLVDGVIIGVGLVASLLAMLTLAYLGCRLYERLLIGRERRRQEHDAMMRHIRQIDAEYKELWR